LFFIKFSLSFVKQTDARIIKRFFFANLPFAKNFSKSIACWLLRYFSTPLKYSQFLFYIFYDSELACLSSIPNIEYGKLASSKKLLNGSQRNERSTRI